MANNFYDEFFIKENSKFKIEKSDTEYKGKLTKEESAKMLLAEKNKMAKLQETLYADGSKALLVILQAMDAAGKDSLIEHVFGDGVNPQGCTVTSFKTPNSHEYEHDFLWRHYLALPEKGKIGIFNRSHYETVLVCKVHPEYNLNEKTWKNVKDFDEKFWKERYESIRDFEKHISRNGTRIIKFFLNVSKKEQKERFLDRINEQDKNWKFSAADLKERALWSKYQKAFEEAINETSTDYAPWFVLPADNKWFTRLAACSIINQTLQDMKPEYPELSGEAKNALLEAKKQLEKE